MVHRYDPNTRFQIHEMVLIRAAFVRTRSDVLPNAPRAARGARAPLPLPALAAPHPYACIRRPPRRRKAQGSTGLSPSPGSAATVALATSLCPGKKGWGRPLGNWTIPVIHWLDCDGHSSCRGLGGRSDAKTPRSGPATTTWGVRGIGSDLVRRTSASGRGI